MDSYFGRLLFGFRGRINRGKYWMAVLAYTSMMIAVVGLDFFLLPPLVSVPGRLRASHIDGFWGGGWHQAPA